MSKNTQTFLAIGSNLDPLRHITLCLERLRTIPDTWLCVESSWYRTHPWGIEVQPDFVNLVVGLTTRLSPRDLLHQTQTIEQDLERVRTVQNGPRTIDLDILLFGDCVLDEEGLQIPHPGLLLRDFMLIPLIEVAPTVVHPERGLAVGELTGEIRYHQIIERLPTQAGG